jgi:hypothetical protein
MKGLKEGLKEKIFAYPLRRCHPAKFLSLKKEAAM